MYTIEEIKNRILQGDSLTVLKTLPSESIDCICTSPPYWALRDYKVDGQIGNEKTIDEYINNLINIFNECKRILKKEGTCWVVIGDTYSGHKGEMRNPGYKDKEQGHQYRRDAQGSKQNFYLGIDEVTEKSLCLIPERFALKMIENKWILRNKIIWYKPNCMPSSAKDRFTVDYENIYFFTKSQKYYFKTQYEPMSEATQLRDKYHFNGAFKGQFTGTPNEKRWQNTGRPIEKPNFYKEVGRIKRCVWKISTKPFPEAHFAVFPEELVKQCLDAGCPPNGVTLDPFIGSGTTALVALKNAMNFVGIELNPDYIKMAMKRITPYLKQEKLTQFTR